MRCQVLHLTHAEIPNIEMKLSMLYLVVKINDIMKKFILLLVAFSLSIVVLPAFAQTKVDKTLDKVEHPIAKTGTVVAAKVTDKELKDVKGPKGESVYVDNKDRRYYINKLGHKVFLKKK